MKMKTVPLAGIKPYERNPRRNDGAVDAVAESIRQCGYAELVEYCAGNVRAAERGSVVHFEKIEEHGRIDVFDAAVFAVSAYLDDLEKVNRSSGWFDEEGA